SAVLVAPWHKLVIVSGGPGMRRGARVLTGIACSSWVWAAETGLGRWGGWTGGGEGQRHWQGAVKRRGPCPRPLRGPAGGRGVGGGPAGPQAQLEQQGTGNWGRGDHLRPFRAIHLRSIGPRRDVRAQQVTPGSQRGGRSVNPLGSRVVCLGVVGLTDVRRA